MIPVLKTERLTLRAPEIADFPLVAEIATGPRAEGIGGPMSREDAWGEFAQMNMTWLVRGHGYWSVTDRVPRITFRSRSSLRSAAPS